VPAVGGLAGLPRRRPERVFGDRGYDYDKHRRLVRARGITPVIARRSTKHGSGLAPASAGSSERTFAHLHQFKRLLVRYERRAEMHEAMLALGCCLICFRRLPNPILQ
jgi:transposase